jgi:hypothetical protein
MNTMYLLTLCRSLHLIRVVAPDPAYQRRKYGIKPVIISGTPISGTDIAEKVWMYFLYPFDVRPI